MCYDLWVENDPNPGGKMTLKEKIKAFLLIKKIESIKFLSKTFVFDGQSLEDINFLRTLLWLSEFKLIRGISLIIDDSACSGQVQTVAKQFSESGLEILVVSNFLKRRPYLLAVRI